MTKHKISSFEEAFAKIMSATGVDDLQQLTKVFVQSEEKSFSLFKLVNELNHEIENYET